MDIGIRPVQPTGVMDCNLGKSKLYLLDNKVHVNATGIFGCRGSQRTVGLWICSRATLLRGSVQRAEEVRGRMGGDGEKSESKRVNRKKTIWLDLAE